MNVALRAPERPKPSAFQIRQEAIAFCIWRAGKRHNWKVTAADLEEDIRINAKTIRRVSRERGWPLEKGIIGTPAGYSPGDRIEGVDTAMLDHQRAWAALSDRDDA